MKSLLEEPWFVSLATVLGFAGLVWISIGLQDVVHFAQEMRELHAPMQTTKHDDVLRSHMELVHLTSQLIADVESLKGRIVGDAPAGYHRADQVEWCAVFKASNRQKYPDLICPDPRQLPRYLEMTRTTQ